MKSKFSNQIGKAILAAAMAMQIISAKAASTPPTISSEPSGATVATGSNVTFNVTATSTNLNYQWLFDGSPASEATATNSSLVISGAKYGDAGSYSVVVTNDGGGITSSVVVLAVEAPVAITGQPTATNIWATNTARSLSVTATGDDLVYQWYKGTAPVSGATRSNLSFASLSTTDAGTYAVVISNLVSKVTSANAVVLAVVAPAITTQPAGKGLALGSNYTMSVTPTGSYLHYFWSQIGTNSLTNAVGGDTNKLTITGAGYTDAGTYSVLVSNLAGTVTSSAADITVQASPVITGQPTATNIWATNTSQSLSVTATGDGLVYQWYKGSTAVSGATLSNLSFSSLAASDAGTYSVVISNLASKVTSANALVIPVVLPAITAQPAGKGLALGSNYAASVTATGSYLHYFWSQIGTNSLTNAVGGDTNKLTITGAGYTDAGTYSVLVSNLAGTVTSSKADITVQASPVITGQPTATNIWATNTLQSLSVTATGDGLVYQWYKGTASVSGATRSNLSFSSLATSDAGTYSVVISNLASKVTSGKAVVIPVVAPVITAQPKGKGLALGSNYAASVTATGSYLHYFWSQIGTNSLTNAVGGDTNQLTITGAEYTDAGTYSVLVSNVAGTVTSSKADITVQAPLVITGQPIATNIWPTNSSQSLSVTATGDALVYQWYKGSTAVSGATGTNLVFDKLSTTNAGTYTVVISNLASKVTSGKAVVIPVVLPVITAQPAGKAVVLGSNDTLSVTASGTYLHYFWSQNGTNYSLDTNGNTLAEEVTNSVGGDTNKLAIIGAAYTNAGTYSVMVSNLAGTVTSSNAIIAVQARPTIDYQIGGSTNAVGDDIFLWFMSSGDSLGFNITKDGKTVTNETFAISNWTAVPANWYPGAQYQSIWNQGWGWDWWFGPMQSQQAEIWYDATLGQPSGVYNSSFFFNLFGPEEGMMWQPGSPSQEGWYPGDPNYSVMYLEYLDITNATVANGGKYQLTITNAVGSVSSAIATVAVVPAPVIKTQPVGKGLAFGSNYTMSVTASGTFLHYFWSQIGTNSLTNAVGGDTNKLTITGAQYTNAGTYTVLVSNLDNTTLSTNVFITVQALPVITGQPAATNIWPTNSSQSLSVTATGDGLVYQWYKGSTAVSGATGANLVFNNLSTTNAGTYSVVISNYASKVTSGKAVVIPVVAPVITTQPLGKGLALGSNYTLSAAASGPYLHYFWSRIGTNSLTNAVGGDTNKLTISGAQYTNAGTYTVLVSNLTGSVTSSNANISVQVPPAIVTQPLASTNQLGGTISLSVAATGDGLNFLWTKDGKSATNGSTATVASTGAHTTNTLTITNALMSSAGEYQVTVSNYVSSLKSAAAKIAVVAPPTLKVAETNVLVLQSASATLLVTAAGTGPFAYQWNFNGTNNITRATNANYAITNMTSDMAGTYQVTVTNLGGSTVTNILVTYVADTNPPTIILTGAGATFSNATLKVTGTATDNVAVSNVVFSLDQGVTFSNAVTTNKWTNFAITSTLTNVGTNTLIVKGVDVNGNWTAPSTNHPVYAPLYTVAITTSGTGTVSSNWTGKVQWGKTYDATAKPGVNFVLVGWTGSITTNVADAGFSPTSNMTLTATFTTNIFIGHAGSYNGLFSGTNGGTNLQQNGGYLTLAVTTNQTYSGKIYVQGVSAPLSGSFKQDGTLVATNTLTNGTTLAFNLSMNFSSKELVGTISNAAWISTNLEADLAVFGANNPTTHAGTYTLVIPTQSGQGLGSGYGSGTVVVATNGTITFLGEAADGTSLSQSTTLSKDGYWPFYVPLYPAGSPKVDQGLVMGWLQFTNTPGGNVTWVDSTASGLAASAAPIESSVFVSPAKGVSRVITNRLATITFSGAGLASTFNETLVIANDGTVASDGQATVAISTSGIITGSVVNPTTQVSSKIYGIILQNDPACLGKGAIIGASSLGNFVITAYSSQ